jgi:hypothetical protein
MVPTSKNVFCADAKARRTLGQLAEASLATASQFWRWAPTVWCHGHLPLGPYRKPYFPEPKFLCDFKVDIPSDLAKIRRSKSINRNQIGAKQDIEIVSIYYDTPTRALRRDDISFRLR